LRPAAEIWVASTPGLAHFLDIKIFARMAGVGPTLIPKGRHRPRNTDVRGLHCGFRRPIPARSGLQIAGPRAQFAERQHGWRGPAIRLRLGSKCRPGWLPS